MSETNTTEKVGLIGKIIATPFVLLVVLMLLAFPGVAIFMAYRSISMVTTWQKAKSWVETPATITHLDLEVDSDSDGATHRVVCNYTYVFKGVSYRSDRVGLTGGASDNIGSWQQDTYNRLKQHQNGLESDTVTCWVNPTNPSEAVLDRSLRKGLLFFSLLFAVVFGGVSVVVVWFGRIKRRRNRLTEALRLEHCDRPWMCKTAWAEGRIRPQQKIGRMWLFAILWNGLSLPTVLLSVPDALRSGQYWMLILLLFPLIGLVLLSAAIVATLRHRRYGRSRFDMETVPGVIGGYLRGTLVITGDIAGIEDISVALRCINRVTRRKGEGDETTERPMWEDARTLRAGTATYGQTELCLPVDFQIPYDCLPCDDSNPKDQILWQLTAKADIPGANLDLKFDVPVFRTEASQTTIGEAPEKTACSEAIIEGTESPLPRKMWREAGLSGDLILVVSGWPGWATFILTTVAATGVLIGGGIWLRSVWQNGGWSILMPAALCLAGAVALRAVIRGFLGSTRITVSLAEVIIERWPRFLHRKVEIPAIDIQEIKISDSAQVRSGSEMTQYYVVHLVTTHGRKIKL
ncbi:MAG: DUF3592 domain-containing protein, partial [Planctomycetes bacterium]|nr:DUF3592 domain-containing protein [Planctomycetota bacterium]